MAEAVIDLDVIEIVGPTPEAIDALKADFERSALDWLDRASRAEIEGRNGDAATALVVAGIAIRVALGSAQ